MSVRKRFAGPLALTAFAATAAALVAGCGGGDSSGEEKEQEAAASPAKAVAEIAPVRQGLAAGLAAYRQSKSKQAERLVGDAYLEHFELVEGPLEERDEDLNEKLEGLIGTEIRNEIKRGAEVAVVAALISEADRELGAAEKALKE